MKDIDMEKVFGVFRDESLDLLNNEEEQSIQLNEGLHLITVVSSVESYHLLDKAYLENFHELYENVQYRVKEKVYDRIYALLGRITINDYSAFVSVIREITLSRIHDALNSLMEHFIKLEEYEKCSKIKKVLDTVEFLDLSVGKLPIEKKVEL